MAESVGRGFRGPEGRVGYLLRQAHQALRTAIDQEVAAVGITAPQFSLLSAVRHEPGVTATELAENSLLTQQTASEIVRTLEKRGMVERRGDPSDGRVQRIHLTDAGLTSLREADELVAGLEEETLGNVSSEQWQEVARWLVECASTFEDRRPKARKRR